MQVRLLLGPAGSGKTFRCLAEIREALAASPDGPALILVAPKQGTYQLEQQLLATASLAGYTRLSIVSFEALARLVLNQLGKALPRMLTEEGRLMVLRSLLSKKRSDLKLFRASARLTGFALQLSQVLHELQGAQLTPEALNQLAAHVPDSEGLSYKLQDLSTLLQEYLHWLEARDLQDEDSLLRAAVEALRGLSSAGQQESDVQRPESGKATSHSLYASSSPFRIGTVWVDGFADFSDQELDLLGALTPYCGQATLTFCLDAVPSKTVSWLSHWSSVLQTFKSCQKRFATLPNVEISVEPRPRHPAPSRFLDNSFLQHLERWWAEPRPYPEQAVRDPLLEDSLRVVACPDPEGEVTLAAREILRFARVGGRYRDVSVVVRKLDAYHALIQRVFSRYQIPFFLDRRESVSHHPLAELTRSAVRTVAFGWQHEDWFAALKSGLVPAFDHEIDLLENESLARGWHGRAWLQPIHLNDVPRSAEDRERLRRSEVQLENIRCEVVPPFEKFALALASSHNKPAGPQLAEAVRDLWAVLNVEQRLEVWAAAEPLPLESRARLPVHETVWNQMNAWLDNAALAFPAEALPLREWLPILEAGLAGLSVGIIPPSLDQVLVGAIDRSRTPEVKLALVLGLNQTVFPAAPEPAGLLTDSDRLELEQRNVVLGSNARQQLGRERYYAYIACTRARQRLVMTSALRDLRGAPLNPSSFLSQVRQLFPKLQFEVASGPQDWSQSEHVTELIGPLLRMRSAACEPWSDEPATHHPPRPTPRSAPRPTPPSALLTLPALAPLLESLRHFQDPQPKETLAPELAARLYGPALRTSVSRMEQFAACPFKFLVHSGLRGEERKLFELDTKEQGTFQHDVLALFHQQLRADGLRWRDITPQEARERVARIARGLITSFRDGLLQASEESRFTAGVLTESLQDFVETLVGWMRQQYQFDPVEVELPFGEDPGSPAWTLDLGNEHRLELYGRIDRIDLYQEPDAHKALCVVVDYKSSQKQLDPILLAHGLQLQLLTYLNVLRQWPNPRATFGVDHLEPAGVFYVNLRGRYDRKPNRLEALADPEKARRLAYRHSGRFDVRALLLLDSRPEVREGDQFNFRLTNEGRVYQSSKEALAAAEFQALLAGVESNLKTMGQQIYAGRVEVGPYRKGSATACDQCTYQAICRIDPWTHHFRVLRTEAETET